MLTSNEITTIILEKGNEDIGLYQEIIKLISIILEHTDIKTHKQIIENFPNINNLKQKLNNELHEQQLL